MVGVLASATREITSLGASLVDLSSKTALSLAEVQEFGFAGKQVGVELTAVSDAVLRLQRRAAAGLPETNRFLQQVGVTTAEIINQRPADAFLQTVDAIKQLSTPAEQAAAAMGIFGDQGLKILPLIRSDVNATIDEFRALGGVINDDVLRAGKALDDQMTSLSAAFTGLKGQIAGGTVPALAEMSKLMTNLIKLANDLDLPVENLGSRFIAWSIHLNGIAENLEHINRLLGVLNLDALTGRLPTVPNVTSRPHLPLGPVGPQGDALLKFFDKQTKEIAQSNKEMAKLAEEAAKVATETFNLAAVGTIPDILALPEAVESMQDVDVAFQGLLTRLTSLGPPMDAHVAAWDEHLKQQRQAEEAIRRFRDEMFSISNLANVVSGTFGQIVSSVTSAASGFQAILSSGGLGALFRSGGGILGGISAIAGPLSAIAGPAIEGIKALLGGRTAKTVMEEAGRELGVSLSEGLARTIHESGRNLLLFLPEIFAEGRLAVDDLARSIGDIFSGLQQGRFGRIEAIDALERSTAVLLQNLDQLGPTGEEQIQRIIGTARSLGVEFEGLADLVQSAFAPSTVEGLMDAFELTRDQIRGLEEATGVRIQNNLQRMAAEAGLTAREFRELRDAAAEHGIDMDQIDHLAGALGISVADLATAWGVDVAKGIEGANTALIDNTAHIGNAADQAGRLADELWSAARASHDIGIPSVSGSGVIPAKHGFDAVVSRPTFLPILAGEGGRPERVTVSPLPGGGSRPTSQAVTFAPNITVQFTGPVSDRDTFEEIAIDAIGRAMRATNNRAGLSSAFKREFF